MRKHIALLFIALLTVAVSAQAQTDDQQKYCTYLDEQAQAMRDQLRTPSLLSGFVQPNTGLPMQLVWGAQSSFSNIRKSKTTMAVSKDACALYKSTTDAQQHIEYAFPALEKEALQHRLVLIEQATATLDMLIETNAKLVDAQNLTKPSVYSLNAAKARLAADRSTTELSLSTIYTPPNLNDTPLKDLVSQKQRDEEVSQKSLNRLTKQSNWDVNFILGIHHQITNLDPTQSTLGAYGEITASYNFGTRAVNRHLDKSAAAYADWKLVQEGDVVRNTQILKQHVVDSIAVYESNLKVMNAEVAQIDANLELITSTDTVAALVFRNTLTTDRLNLRVEIGDTQFRLDSLKQYLQDNF